MTQRYNVYGGSWNKVEFTDKHVCRLADDHIIVEIERSGKIHEMIVDVEGFEMLKQLKRKIGIDQGYATVSIGKKLKKIHRLIMNPPDDLVIDHINGNKLDNRKSNLRLATDIQNGQNRKVKHNAKSGIRGVSKSGNKWRASVTINKRTLDLGSFNELAEAGRVASEARAKYMPFSQEAMRRKLHSE